MPGFWIASVDAPTVRAFPARISPKTRRMDDAIRYRLLKLLHERPHLTQRELAKAMGISLGKANFCLRALIAIGAVKANNFKKSANKSGYLYLLTPRGLEEKARVTRRFLERKRAEYEAIQREIEELRAEHDKTKGSTI